MPNSSSHILIASPSSCSCWTVLCWIRFSLSMCLRNMALAIQRYGHTTRKHRCIPVFGYAFHSHLGLGQSMGITVEQKDGPRPKGQGQPERRWINMEPVGGIKPPAAGHQASSITYPGKGQGPGTRLKFRALEEGGNMGQSQCPSIIIIGTIGTNGTNGTNLKIYFVLQCHFKKAHHLLNVRFFKNHE